MNRRACLVLLVGAGCCFGKTPQIGSSGPKDWVCPMDPDYRSTQPGVCPRCGMTLVAQVPERIEYPVEVSYSPEDLKPGDIADIKIRVLNPVSGQGVQNFRMVHEKLMHLFLVSENLQFFAHLHPEAQRDGSFLLRVRLPYGGMYRMLADYYPENSVPQLAVNTLFVDGVAPSSELKASLVPCRSQNLTSSLRLDPIAPVAGLETKLFYDLTPSAGLQPYLGAWGHLLAVSSDLIDLLHLHPFLANGGPTVQFNIIFPRPGLHRIWAQFQREGVVNTVQFTVPVKSL